MVSSSFIYSFLTKKRSTEIALWRRLSERFSRWAGRSQLGLSHPIGLRALSLFGLPFTHKNQSMSGNKGDALIAEAERTLNRSSVASFFGFSSTQKYEDAGEIFVKAGNAYKLANLYESAGNAFLRAAESYAKAENCATEVVNHMVEAANNFKKINPVKAIETFQQAIERYNDAGRFGMSARYYKEIAEIFEADGNKSAASDAYEHAAEMFERDNKKSNGNTCLLKVAQFSAEEGNYVKAAQIYESNGREGLTSRLGAFGAKGHFFMALLCYLALGDSVQVTNKLNEYKSLDHSFPSSRECGFVEKLVQVGRIFVFIKKYTSPICTLH